MHTKRLILLVLLAFIVNSLYSMELEIQQVGASLRVLLLNNEAVPRLVNPALAIGYPDGPATLALEIVDSNGVVYPLQSKVSVFSTPPDEFRILYPDEIVGVCIPIDRIREWFLISSGTYTIRCVYRNHVSTKPGSVLGPIYSKGIRVDVGNK